VIDESRPRPNKAAGHGVWRTSGKCQAAPEREDHGPSCRKGYDEPIVNLPVGELKMVSRSTIFALAAMGATCLTPLAAQAQTPANAPVRVVGAIKSVTPDSLVVKTANAGDQTVLLSGKLRVTAVDKASLSDIKKGDFVGSATSPGPNGTMRAIEVHIFSEAQRGTGEGSRPFPAVANGTMTNADVTSAVDDVEGRTLTLTYKGGAKQISVPKGALIVKYSDGSPKDLIVGAQISATVQAGQDGKLTASRVSVARPGGRLPF
jgi:hypothetical protein